MPSNYGVPTVIDQDGVVLDVQSTAVSTVGGGSTSIDKMSPMETMQEVFFEIRDGINYMVDIMAEGLELEKERFRKEGLAGQNKAIVSGNTDPEPKVKPSRKERRDTKPEDPELSMDMSSVVIIPEGLSGAKLRKFRRDNPNAIPRDEYDRIVQKQTANQKLCKVRNIFEKHNVISSLHSYFLKEDTIYKNLLPPLALLTTKKTQELEVKLNNLNFGSTLVT